MEKRRPKIAFFTGAGISEPSGVPTFRSKEGLWNQIDPLKVCSVEGYSRNRDAVLGFHNELRRVIDKANPNDAHQAISRMEAWADVTVVTQNVDDLHERSGSSNIIKIHGSIHRAKLKRYKNPTISWREDILPDSFLLGWERCRGTMRHDVVFFGETIQCSRAAQSALNSCDYLIVCGTSLLVEPAASLALLSTSSFKIYVDLSPAADRLSFFKLVINGDVTDGVNEAISFVKEREGV